MQRLESERLFEEAKQYFPGGVNSPVRAFKSVYGAPLFIKEGVGAYILDEDNQRYLDFCCSWGPLILGHAYPPVIDRITEVIQKGTSFGTPNRLGNQIGKLILDNNRFVEQIRFVSSGTEAVMSAVRLARGYTSKNKILKFEGCYHGHVDSLLVKAGSGLVTFGESSSEGIPECLSRETLVAPLDDLNIVEEIMKTHSNDLAAVIIEPIPANNGLLIQRKAYLQGLRSLCTKYGVLLIFDEVISGFRVGFEGAAGFYKIKPDIVTYGKIIGGGMPVGAFGASKEIMSKISPLGGVYQAGTLSANPVAMAAGIATMNILLNADFYKDLEAKTSNFVEHINAHIRKMKYAMRVEQIGSIFWFNFSTDTIRRSDQIDAQKAESFKEMHKILLEKGIYLGPSAYEVGFVSHAHEERSLIHAASTINQTLDQIFQ